MSTTDIPATLVVTRKFKSPPEKVFAAFTSLDALSQWFGPEGCGVLGESVDFRVGGEYRLKLSTPHGEMVVAGAYREILPPARIVFTWQWQDDEDWEGLESVITIDLRPVDGGTELRLTQSGFPSEESRSNHNHGWMGCFDKLEKIS